MTSGSANITLSPKPPKDTFRSPTKSRDSCVSTFSSESYNPSEIGEAVELSVEEQHINQGPVKHTYMPGNSPDTIDGKQPTETAGDNVSVFSSSTVLLGRLDTVRNFTKTNNPPEITVETPVESVVPPRSRKRPQSEIITSKSTSRREVSNHRYRFSVDLTDGLDTLMKKASDLTESGEGSLDPPLDNSGSGLGSGFESGSRSGSTGRSFSYETADQRSVGGGGGPAGEKPTTPLVLPKRPSAKNLDRARKVSLSRRQVSGKNHDSDSIADTSVYSTDAVSTSTWHDNNLDRANPLDRTIGTDRSQKTPSHLPHAADYHASFSGKQLGPDGGSRRILSSEGRHEGHEELPRTDADAGTHPWRGPGSISSNYSWTRSNPSVSSKVKPEEFRSHRAINESEGPSGGSVIKTRHAGASTKQSVPRSGGSAADHPRDHPRDHPSSNPSPEFPSQESPENTSSSHPSSGPTLQHAGPSDKRHSAQLATNSSPSTLASPHVTAITEGSAESRRPTQKLHKKYVSIKKKPDSPEKPKQDPDSSQIQVDDDGYYDIEEPVVVSHPARAKSVRDNTRALPRKASKRRSRRTKQRESNDVANLKPFSYNTLVHLLESMNGAVIGEEFETLNLPIQEKQLIEKLIDSLSRLTSDMVLDENRFDIGIQRLEKAHRVLEGFL